MDLSQRLNENNEQRSNIMQGTDEEIAKSLQQNYELESVQSLGTTLRTEIYTSDDEREQMDFQDQLNDLRHHQTRQIFKEN